MLLLIWLLFWIGYNCPIIMLAGTMTNWGVALVICTIITLIDWL